MDWYLSCCGLYVHMCVSVAFSASPLRLLSALVTNWGEGIILHTRGAACPSIYLAVLLSAALPLSPVCHQNRNPMDTKQTSGASVISVSRTFRRFDGWNSAQTFPYCPINLFEIQTMIVHLWRSSCIWGHGISHVPSVVIIYPDNKHFSSGSADGNSVFPLAVSWPHWNKKNHRSFRKMTPAEKMKRFSSWRSCLHACWVLCCGLGARRALTTAGTAGHLTVPGIRALPGTKLDHTKGLLVKAFTRTP